MGFAVSFFRKAGLGIALLLGLSSAQGHAAEPKLKPPVSFSLESFFTGRAIARGTFVSELAGVRRDFTVKTRGKWDGKRLVLVEDIIYDDGQVEQKTWRITKTAPGKYTGQRDDVVGDAEISQEGDRIELAYTADVFGKDGSATRVRFSDVIVPAGPRAARNIATVYKYFIPIGTVDITFHKIGR